MTLSALFAMHRAQQSGWIHPAGWLRLLRSAQLLLHPSELAALLDLEIVKGRLMRARGPGALSFLADRHSLARNLPLEQRLDCALYHYRFEQSAFSGAYLDSVYSEGGLPLWRQRSSEHDFEVRLMIANDNLTEGFLSSVAFIDGQRVCVMSFSFVDAMLFGAPAGPALFVTRKQSGRHPEHQRHFARSFKHTSPAYFSFAAIAGVARALDLPEVALIRHQAHPGYSPGHAEVMRKSYDEFWHSLGASELDAKAFRVPVKPEPDERSNDASPSHRSRARKRRQDRMAVEDSAYATLLALRRQAPASRAAADAECRPA